MYISKICFIATTLSISTSAVNAKLNLTDNISLSGFGSTSITQSNNATPLYVNREITDNTCYDCDTTLGLQGDIRFNDNFNTSIQIVKRPQDSWSSPRLEWVYVGYSVSDFHLKAGRLRLPLFLSSEYYYVGQAYTSARPPQEVYNSTLGLTSYDGLSGTWDIEINDESYLAVTPYVGIESNGEVDIGDNQYGFNIEKTVGIHSELSGFDYRIMFNYAYFEYVVDVTTPQGTMQLPADNISIYTLGTEYSLDQWLLTAEVLIDTMHFNWYSSLAYNIDKFTPYVTYAESHHSQKNNSLLIGLRYDLTTTVSLNTEWKYTNAKGRSNGELITAPIDGDTNAQLYTIMLNFIF
ncbi:hypothetical protein ACU5B6_08230 [Moritella viscosa]|uniref:hypothetical protein n=1 Tax=Moritella viscosa TaxID=80854 RepID=UPI000917B52E|nr:hypothetical protein [Moritella viscosa]SHO14026.1 Putative uncharacterized protein [Moritella viscosa]SHO14029.1 Putative uncharacterized protein [Moritella viscosa]SHO18743.1 Putative uncharacterized protein [Moritella viscosa]